MTGPNKAVRSQLSVGRRPETDGKEATLFLMVCTAKDMAGTKYKIKDNIEAMFVKFAYEGKATIRFREPPHDIIMKKADSLQLKNFLNVVKLGTKGGDELKRISLSSLVPARAKQVEKQKTRLVISSRRDYPLTSNFPGSLEDLKVNTCSLKRIDLRIMQLKHLKILDLSDNKLTTLPETVGGIQSLAQLNLSKNTLSNIPGTFLKSISESLGLLDLSRNKLKYVHQNLCNLRNLVTLKLDHNALEGLPPRVGDLQRLRNLSVSSNRLKILPGSFRKLRLDNLDLFGNQFHENYGTHCDTGDLTFPSLKEWAGRAVYKYSIPHQPEDVGMALYDFLKSVKWCLCGEACFNTLAPYKVMYDLRLVNTVSALDLSGRTTVPLLGYVCSNRCLKKFKDASHGFRAFYWK